MCVFVLVYVSVFPVSVYFFGLYTCICVGVCMCAFFSFCVFVLVHVCVERGGTLVCSNQAPFNQQC